MVPHDCACVRVYYTPRSTSTVTHFLLPLLRVAMSTLKTLLRCCRTSARATTVAVCFFVFMLAIRLVMENGQGGEEKMERGWTGCPGGRERGFSPRRAARVRSSSGPVGSQRTPTTTLTCIKSTSSTPRPKRSFHTGTPHGLGPGASVCIKRSSPDMDFTQKAGATKCLLSWPCVEILLSGCRGRAAWDQITLRRKPSNGKG